MMGEAIPKEAATKESAPKEGSMEDILASIRRIISADTSKNAKPVRVEPEAVKNDAPAISTPASSLESVRRPLAVDAQKPVTGSLSALANQIRSENSSIATEKLPEVKTTDFQTNASSIEFNTVERSDPKVGLNAAEKPSTLSELAKQVVGTTSVPASSQSPEPVIKKEYEPLKQSAILESKTEVVPAPQTADEKPALSLKELASQVNSAANLTPDKNTEKNTENNVLANATRTAQKTESEANIHTGMDVVNSPAPIAIEKSAADERPAIEPKPEASEMSLAAFKEALVAPSTQAAVTNSMDRLRRSVEDIDTAQVENILRPMLKSWLDANLPSMVERMVQEEISKITEKK